MTTSLRAGRLLSRRVAAAFATILIVATTALPAAAQDTDNDGLPDASDPCSADARNLCAGPVAIDTSTLLPIRINANATNPAVACAGSKLDCQGNTWTGDFGWNRQSSNSECNLGGSGTTSGDLCVITGITTLFGCQSQETMDIFQCDHYDLAETPAKELSYHFNVPNGRYIINLFFANTRVGTAAAGSRVFDISVEGVVKYTGFDQVVAAGGSGKAVVRAVDVTVTDGNGLSILFTHGAMGDPAIKAIEILSAGGCTSNAQCNDGKVCTTDTCVASSCQYTNNTASCSDGLTCTSGDICGGGVCTGTSNCPSGQICSAQSGVCQSNAQISFNVSQLVGETLTNPTALDFGPDGKLYVAQQNGTILGYTIQKNAPNNYVITNTQTINLVHDIPNHNDDGSLAPTQTGRLLTGGLVAAGTAANPVLYVASGDPRIGGGANSNNTNLDTNSGIISRLTWDGSAWVKLDLVRGLPRSEENHSANGMVLDTATNKLYVAYGGHTNMGAPSNNFVFLPEYALSAAVLSIDLTAIGNATYDLPTLDDETRTGPGTTDANDPFGGDDGKNQAKLVPGGPVQVYAPGFRNPYDLVKTQAGRMYTIDNGPNASWGNVPINEGPAGNCTNDISEPGKTYSDNLHFITGPGFYGGHPNPTRARMANTFNLSNPQSPVTVDNPVECDFRTPTVSPPTSTADGALALFTNSTNGLTEYTTSDFGGQMQGNLLSVSLNGNLYRIELNAAGNAVTTPPSALFTQVGTEPLDVIALAATDPYPGTIWVVDHGSDAIFIFEPNVIVNCTGANNPSLDEDNDRFDNADEIANSTDPCSSADFPPDADGDFTSDLIDTDDDNDSIPDTSDKFAVDAANGTTTGIPLLYGWENDEPPHPGILQLGFTGLMTNGTSDYQSLFDKTKMTAGGAAGVTTVDEVAEGDALGATNTQKYGFQFGINTAGSAANVFTIRTRIVGPFLGIVPADFQSMGLFIGNGDQDNYFKLVVSSNGGAGGIQSLLETGGVAQTGPTDPVTLPGPDVIDLFLVVDKTALTVQPAYSLTNLGVTSNIFYLGSPVSIPQAWLTDPSSGLAVGILSTSRGTAPVFPATWDFVEIVVGAPNCTTNLACDDGNPCTTDFCDGGLCANVPLADQTPCSDGVACTGTDQCTAGVCGGVDSCPLFQACNIGSGTCGTVAGDPDNDGLSGNGDPCPNDPRNFCYGTVAVDGTTSKAIRIHTNTDGAAECGGTKIDCAGKTWLSSFGQNTGNNNICNLNGGGEACVISGLTALFGCEDEATSDLFQCYRYDKATAPELLYNFNVPNGDYLVNLFFANPYSGTTTGGSRVFDINVEGVLTYDNFDPIGAAGGSGIAAVRSAVATVGDSNGLQIEFLHGVENPAIQAIEVLAKSGTPPPPCASNADCIDSTVCNGTETCNVGVGCVAGTPLTCNDGNACNGAETCNPTTGCQSGTPPTCDDGNFCNGAESCVAPTGCQSGTPPNCSDSDPCTTDTCSANQCQHSGACSGGTVQLDATSVRSVCEGTAADTTTLASVTVGSQANRILVVEVGAEEDNADCNLALASATATYGGVAMTKAVTMVSDTTAYRSCNGIFYLLNPATGTANVVVTFPATTGTPIDNRQVAAFVLTGAAQQGPEVIATAGADNNTTPVNTNITPLTIGSLIVDVFSHGATGTTVGPSTLGTTQTGQSKQWDKSDALCVSSSAAGSTKPVTSLTQTQLGWSRTSATRYAHSLAAFKPAAGTPPPTTAKAFVTITPSGGINASTYGINSFNIRNDSASGQTITQVRIDFSTTVMPDLVYDPLGKAGDLAAKCLEPGTGAVATGFVAPVDLCATPFSVPYELGYKVIDVFFTDFNPTEVFGFAVDADPTSIRGTNGNGSNSPGSISGLELGGATVTVVFSDGSTLSGQVFRGGTSLSLSQNIINVTTIAAPTIAAVGITAPATVTSASQTIRVTGPVGASVRLLRVEGDMNLNGGTGYDLDPFEANNAVTVGENAATIGAGGFVDIPVTLTRTSDSSDLNTFSAVVVNSDGSGQTSLVSNGIVLEYAPPAAAGTVLIDSASIRSACEGTAADTITITGVPVGSQTNRILVVEVGAEEDNADCDLASATATYGGVAMSKAVTMVSDTTTWRSCNGIFYLLNPTTGSANVVVTFPSTITTGTSPLIDNRQAAAFVLTGAAQQAPEAIATAGADATTNPINTNITPLTVGSLIVDVFSHGSTSTLTTTQTGQTKQWEQSCTSSSAAGSAKPVSALAQTTLGWSRTSATRYAHSLAAFAPAPSGGFMAEALTTGTTVTSSTTSTTLDE